VSFHSALYHHGLIEQIPQVVYAATLAPTRRIETPVCVVSLHQLAPEMFGEYEYDPRSEANIATPEKALVDFLYLRPAKSQLFRALPELELPRSFSRSKARKLAERIPAVRRRAMVLQLLERAG
jgi:predicted transcriptional regulator of viral defense system